MLCALSTHAGGRIEIQLVYTITTVRVDGSSNISRLIRLRGPSAHCRRRQNTIFPLPVRSHLPACSLYQRPSSSYPCRASLSMLTGDQRPVLPTAKPARPTLHHRPKELPSICTPYEAPRNGLKRCVDTSSASEMRCWGGSGTRGSCTSD
jgi:hypothetical protein